MTVQALPASFSKEFPDLNLDDLLGPVSLDLPIPSQDLRPALCSLDDDLLQFDRDDNWASPDGEDECAFAFGELDKEGTRAIGQAKSSITWAPSPSSPFISPVTSAFTMAEKVESGSAFQGVMRPAFTTGIATRLRTGAQPPKRLLSPSVSMSGSESSSPSFEREGTSAVDDLPEMKFKKGKRKKEVDLDTIDDPNERRKQRRLAKNRATAALSRQRKRDQMSTLIARVRVMDADNAKLKEENSRLQQERAQFSYNLQARDLEISHLRGELASLCSGAGGATGSDASAPGREPAVLTGGDPMFLTAGEPLEDFSLLPFDDES